MEKRKEYGLLGKNISYSLSPIMHNAAFKHFGINAEYKIIDKEDNQIKVFFRELSEGRFSGINVTVPYKVDVFNFLNEEEDSSLVESAQNLGAVNTVLVEDGGMRGYNTDGQGFFEAITEGGKIDESEFAGKKVLVLGAGGASRAICFYLASRLKESKIYIYDIDAAKVKSLKNDFEEIFGTGILRPLSQEEIHEKIKNAKFLINATPLGTKEGDTSPVDTDLLHDDLMVYDLVYARETELVKDAKEKGLKASGGIGMLVNQAALAFSIWTDEEFALEDIRNVMKKALPKELKRTYGWNIW